MINPSIDRLVEEARGRAADRRRGFVWAPDGEPAAPPVRPPPPGRPLEVLLSSGERTLFNYVRDPRLNIRVHLPGAPLEAQPDVVVLTRIDRSDPATSSAHLPGEVWKLLSEGRAALVLDASGEGSQFWPEIADRLHEFLRSRGVPLSMAAYVTQDRYWPIQYATYCDAKGLGPGDRGSIWVHDLYIQRTIFEAARRGEQMFEQRLEAYAARGRRRGKRFICLNRTIRPVKALFLMRLMQEGLFDAGYISLGLLGQVDNGRVISLDAFSRLLAKVHGIGHLGRELQPYLEPLAAKGQVSFGPESDAPTKAAKQATLRAVPLKEYAKSWFTVVTESHASDRLHRITEKPLKPLLNFHPFLVLGSVGSLRLIKAYGFDTFPTMFDESYDETRRLNRRFEAVVREVRQLCQVSEATMARLDAEVAPQLVFNAWWGLIELPGLFHSHIEARLIDDLVRICAQRAQAAPVSVS